MIIAANPSTLVNLARAGDQEKEALIRDIHDGTLSDRFDIPADVRAASARRDLQARIPSAPASWKRSSAAPARSTRRTTGRRTASSATGPAAASAPTCGTSRATTATTPVRDVGLIASEGRMTIPLADGTPERRARRHHALLRVHPRGGGRQPAADRPGRPRAAGGRDVLHPADDGLRPVPLPHPRPGARAPASTTGRRWSSSSARARTSPTSPARSCRSTTSPARWRRCCASWT